MESTFYQQIRAEGRTEGRTEGRAEGRTEGARSVLAVLLRELLGGAAEAFMGRLELATDEQVVEATRIAARVRDAEALAAALDALLPPPRTRRPRPARSPRRP